MNTNETNHTNTNDVKRDKIKVCSVSEAKRLESGHIIISGMIASISSLYKIISKSEWRCDNLQCGHYGGEKYNPPLSLPPLYLDNTSNTVNCFKCDSTAFYVKHTFHNARTIQLEDTDKTAAENNNAADRLEVVLYDDASCNVIAGEVVDIIGDLYVQRKVENGGKGKKLVTVFYCNTITYKNKRQVIITPTDIQIIYKHRRICDLAYKKELHAAARNEPWSKKIVPMRYVDRLVAMFAPNVIGHNDAKLGILRSIVGGLANHGNDNGRRGRINTLLVGDPGTAKSLLERESTKILPNSRYVTAQNASGQSLIAIADKENDTLILRLGAVVMAKGAICAINELGAMSMEDQQYLTDIAEEGRCTVDKYGTHFEIDSPTTIIATANPYNGRWSKFNITKEEIPALKTYLDRCDQVYGFRDAPSENEIKEYSRQKTAIRKRRPHNYNLLRKVLTYMKNNVHPAMTNDAEDRLNLFWQKAKIEGSATNRTYDSTFRLAEAQARLNLSTDVDDDIATQAMDSISLMLSQYGNLVETIQSPRDITYRAFYYILKRLKSGITIKELCRIACEENKATHAYLGDNWDMEHNHKIKPIIDILLNNYPENIRLIKQKPKVLLYLEADPSERKNKHLSDVSDSSDVATY